MPSTLPLIGKVVGAVESVRTISIHGDLYHDMVFQMEGHEQGVMVRVPQHLMPEPPVVHERLCLDLLMGQVQGVSRAEENDEEVRA